MLRQDIGMLSRDGVPEDRDVHRQELEGDGALHGLGGAIAGVSNAEELLALLE